MPPVGVPDADVNDGTLDGSIDGCAPDADATFPDGTPPPRRALSLARARKH
jgi:hypothetical protein